MALVNIIAERTNMRTAAENFFALFEKDADPNLISIDVLLYGLWSKEEALVNKAKEITVKVYQQCIENQYVFNSELNFSKIISLHILNKYLGKANQKVEQNLCSRKVKNDQSKLLQNLLKNNVEISLFTDNGIIYTEKNLQRLIRKGEIKRAFLLSTCPGNDAFYSYASQYIIPLVHQLTMASESSFFDILSGIETEEDNRILAEFEKPYIDEYEFRKIDFLIIQENRLIIANWLGSRWKAVVTFSEKGKNPFSLLDNKQFWLKEFSEKLTRKDLEKVNKLLDQKKTTYRLYFNNKETKVPELVLQKASEHYQISIDSKNFLTL